MKSFVIALGILTWITALGQPIPQPVAPHAPRVWYAAAQAVADGVYSPLSNEVTVTNGMSLDWTPSPTPGSVTLLLSGISSGHYTQTNCVGTNALAGWPIYSPSVVTVLCGGVAFIAVTNPPTDFYRTATTATLSNLFEVQESQDLVTWKLANFVSAPNGNLTVIKN